MVGVPLRRSPKYDVRTWGRAEEEEDEEEEDTMLSRLALMKTNRKRCILTRQHRSSSSHHASNMSDIASRTSRRATSLPSRPPPPFILFFQSQNPLPFTRDVLERLEVQARHHPTETVDSISEEQWLILVADGQRSKVVALALLTQVYSLEHRLSHVVKLLIPNYSSWNATAKEIFLVYHGCMKANLTRPVQPEATAGGPPASFALTVIPAQTSTIPSNLPTLYFTELNVSQQDTFDVHRPSTAVVSYVTPTMPNTQVSIELVRSEQWTDSDSTSMVLFSGIPKISTEEPEEEEEKRVMSILDRPYVGTYFPVWVNRQPAEDDSEEQTTLMSLTDFEQSMSNVEKYQDAITPRYQLWEDVARLSTFHVDMLDFLTIAASIHQSTVLQDACYIAASFNSLGSLYSSYILSKSTSPERGSFWVSQTGKDISDMFQIERSVAAPGFAAERTESELYWKTLRYSLESVHAYRVEYEGEPLPASATIEFIQCDIATDAVNMLEKRMDHVVALASALGVVHLQMEKNGSSMPVGLALRHIVEQLLNDVARSKGYYEAIGWMGGCYLSAAILYAIGRFKLRKQLGSIVDLRKALKVLLYGVGCIDQCLQNMTGMLLESRELSDSDRSRLRVINALFPSSPAIQQEQSSFVDQPFEETAAQRIQQIFDKVKSRDEAETKRLSDLVLTSASGWRHTTD
jgi:hypothetical protein